MSVMDILQSPQRLFTLAAAIVSYLVLVAIYRLYFHPLANFPGSKLVALGRFYEFYYDSLSHGQFYKKIQEMHNIYGKQTVLPSGPISPQSTEDMDSCPLFHRADYNKVQLFG